MLKTRRQRPTDHGHSGQTLVEFALVFPMIILLVMSLLELAFGLQAFSAVNRASQHGAHLASVMGNQDCADVLILDGIESDISSPQNRNRIVNVVIERTALAGNATYAEQKYERKGVTSCEVDGEAISVPYTLVPPLPVDPPPYPEEERCTVLAGCDSLGRSTVDNIGVKVRYVHDWITPMGAVLDVLPGGRNGWAFTQRNIFRMEPTL